MAIKLPLAQLHLALAVVLAPAARTTTSALAPETREIRDGADVLASFGTARGLVKKMDIGALKNGQRKLDPNNWCPPDSVLYQYGNAFANGDVGGVVIPPEQGCNGKCCVGTDACDGFTGCVKKDGSCAGEQACSSAYAPAGIEASCLGPYACYMINYYNVGLEIINSCEGNGACETVEARDGDKIINSCRADYACKNMGYGDVGYLGTVDSSCNADRACYKLGFYGTLGTVDSSCNADRACYELGAKGTLGTVVNSCNAKGACTGGEYNVGYYATIKSITGACNSEKHKSCAPLHGTGNSPKEFGDITQFKRDFRVKKTRAEDIEACMALCAEKEADDLDACRGIKWRQGVQKPCRIFKGGFSEGKCHDKDLCMDL